MRRFTANASPKKRLLPLLVLLLVQAVAWGQDPDKPIRVDVELAGFEISVEDASGQPVHDLKAEDFRLLEDGKEKPIGFFQPVVSGERSRPMTIVFAIDVSGSMTPQEIAVIQNAIGGFIERFVDYRSYFAVVTFAMNVKTLQSFTNRPDKLKESLAKLERDRDGLSTHAFDGTDRALRMIEKDAPKILRGTFPKRAVVLITDGFPVGDVVAPSAVIDRARSSGTTVYSIILPSYSRTVRDAKPVMTLLEASGLMERTGGRSYYAIDDQLEPLFKRLAGEIAASYAVAYYPDEVPEGRRTVTIVSKKGYRVRQNRSSFEMKRSTPVFQ